MRNVNLNDYKHIIPQERINLTIAALSRGDLKEADWLWDTCPKYDYNALDFDYTIRINAFTILSMSFREKCLIHYHHIQRIESSTLLLEYLVPQQENVAYHLSRLDRMDKLREVQISKLKAVYKGLELFCLDVALCYEHILQTAYIGTICPSIELYLSDSIDADMIYVDKFKNEFSEYWRY